MLRPMQPLAIAVWILLISILIGCASDEDKKKAYLDEGKAFIQKKDYKNAVIKLKNAIQIDPTFTEAYVQLADTQMNLGATREAFVAYSRVESLAPENLEVKLKLATLFLLGKNNEEASKRVYEVLDKKPDHQTALIMLGGLMEQKPDIIKAEEIYRAVIEKDQKATAAFYGLARVLAKQQKWEKSEQALLSAAAIDDQDEGPKVALYKFYVARKDKEKAEKTLRSAVEAHPDNVELMFLLGNFYTGLRLFDKAEKIYLQALEKDPEGTKPLIVLGDYYKRTDKPEEAMTMYQKALAIAPEDLAIKAHIARFHLQREELQDAEKLVDEILSERSKHLSARLLKAELLILKQSFKDALDILAELEKEEPKNARTAHFKALALLGLGNRSQAKASLAKAIELNPRQTISRLQLAEIHFRARDYALATAQAKEILAHRPGNYSANRIAGNCALAQGQFETARHHYKILMQLLPNHPESYFRMGLLERKESNYDAALSQFNKALELNPHLTGVYANIVAIHILRKEFDKALAFCDLQIKQHGETKHTAAFAQYLKGSIQMRLGQTKQAEESFSQAMTNDPEYLPPYYATANLLINAGSIDQAISHYNGLLEKKPNLFRAHMLLGTLFDSQGKNKLAEKHYRAALSLNPEFIAAANNLAYLLADKGQNLDEALQLARKAKEKKPSDPNVADTLGYVYLKKGLLDSAVLEFQDSLDAQPDSAMVRYHLAMALNEKGEKKKARKELMHVLQDAKFTKADEARKMLDELNE